MFKLQFRCSGFGIMKGHIMPGTRTAPAVGDSTVTSIDYSIGLIDSSGDKYSEAIAIDTAGTTVDIPTFFSAFSVWTGAYQAATQASLWRVGMNINWEGVDDKSNALVGQRNSVADGINMLFKQNLSSYDQRLVAPIPEVFDGNLDIPDIVVAQYNTLRLAYIALLPGAHSLRSSQFTERRERKNNPKVK